MLDAGFACYSWWLPPPRRLGAAVEDRHELVIVRGVVPSSAECQKITLVNCSCHWVTTCGSVLAMSYRVDEVCETPLSHRTTKCWSTQQGLACWQAREPREKNQLSRLWHSSGDWYYIHLVIGSSPTWRYNHTTCLFTFLQTSWYKLFSVIRIESLAYYLHSSSWAL